MTWQDVVDFVRGTRQRPPPGPSRPRAMAWLVASAFLHMPIVYLLVGSDVWPWLVISVGLVAMGLAWSGGVALEGRRRGTAQVFAGLALAEGLLAFVPVVAGSLGPMRWLFVAVAFLAAMGLLELARAMPAPRRA